MSEFDSLVSGRLPGQVLQTLEHFERAFGALLVLTVPSDEHGESEPSVIYESTPGLGESESMGSETPIPFLGDKIQLQVRAARAAPVEAVSAALVPTLASLFELEREIESFTNEVSQRYEEITLLYSISETLGATLELEKAAEYILDAVRDVMRAKRAALWVQSAGVVDLNLAAQVGDPGRSGLLSPDDPDSLTSRVFRKNESEIDNEGLDSRLSVPVQFSVRAGGSRKVGVITLVGRVDDGQFTPSERRQLEAIASQVGAAIENHRLVQESLSKERMSREMELAHEMQMKLLPAVETFDFTNAAGRVQPAEQVGGDFYQLFELPEGRIGVMLGDVSLHGFPSALIMMLTMSAAGIFAQEVESPASVLRKLDDALSDELATTEMFLSLFYGVIDPARGILTYSNAGHPHAFVIRSDGEAERLVATDPPVGFAGSDSYGEDTVIWSNNGDLLLLFTDGLSDTLETKGLKNGEAQILETAIETRFRGASHVIDALFQFSSDTSMSALSDDRAALVVQG
ncbi:MAG TPA: hypothetical protein DCS75_05770 [Gemmatimonadetes bacterium]|nr:hypothetical protein [Gemmatimonadota bacterium]HAT37980.1 hypothetical protein [Gemmatimonadota bacterium]HBV06036.1 hypothetical protein [Gemmatimonadota bacterium]